MSKARGHASILNYSSYREYLNDYVAYRKQTGQYSLARFSVEVGFRSSNYMCLIINSKRNLTLEDAYLVSRFLKLTTTEGKYLVLLIQFNDASDASEKRFYKSWLKELTSGTSTGLDATVQARTLKPGDSPQLLDEWHTSSLLSCLHPDQGCTTELIVELTGLPKTQVARALTTLVSLRLARYDSGVYFATSHVTDSRFGSHIRFREFQEIHLKRSLVALRGSQTNGAKFATSSFLVNRESQSELIDRIRELIHSTDTSQVPDSDARLLQLNLQLFDFRDGNGLDRGAPTRK